MKKANRGKAATIVPLALVLLIVSFSGCTQPPPTTTTWRVRMRYYVKDDSDPWIKGDGEWFFNLVATTIPPFTGRAPSSGTWDAEEGKTYDRTLATITTSIVTFSVSITVMEDDDVDPDDKLGTKTFQVVGVDLTQTWNTGYFDSTVYITKIG